MAEKFDVHVPDSVLEDLKIRLQRTRLPDELNNVGWKYGTPLKVVKEFVDHWLNHFDWRKQEALLNSFSQFKLSVQNMSVHFIHERSPEPSAIPLLLIHGWPGSVFEFHKILPKLTHPPKGQQAFHVVAPSIPGYGFSSAPTEPGFGVREIARLFDELMVKLGYDHYVAQGGDWGSMITKSIAIIAPKRCRAIHVTLAPTGPPMESIVDKFWVLILAIRPSWVLTEDEMRNLKDAKDFSDHESGYQKIQGTKPQSLGYGLSDSPAGLLAWIIEKFNTWSDCKGNVENRFTKDELLTNVMIYWINNTITSSMRLYYESLGPHAPYNPFLSKEYCSVPTALALFPAELFRPPRYWAAKKYNIQQWSVMPVGGHFSAWEEPDLLAQDMRKFFPRFWPSNIKAKL